MPKEFTVEKGMKRGFVWSLSSLFNSDIYLSSYKRKKYKPGAIFDSLNILKV